MTESDPHDEMRELAALYALGALIQHEARSFEKHLDEGCESCKTELGGFEAVASNLAFAAASAEPPAGTREKLLSLAASEKQPSEWPELAQSLVSVRSKEGRWDRIAEGISVKLLFLDKASGMQTSLVRMAPGVRLPAHRHAGVEQFFVLEGDCMVNGEMLGPGDYHRAQAGSVHDVTYTKHGTLLLLVAPACYEILNAH